jgi:formyltetrahydrofolate hydrolase
MAQTPNYHPSYLGAQPARQAYHHPRTSLGATGHWVKTVGILSPLVIGELVKDPEKRWRYVRLATVATALLSEALWTHRIRKKREEAREHELACRSQG